MHKARARAEGKYLLIGDISRCYHSIYTHSIPWALHTKPIAKANRAAPIVGNLLDRWSRNAQDGQTVGIPIGPDTSFVIAEIVLTACDVALASSLRSLRGFRYIDDYEFSFDDRAQAEAALSMLQEVLAQYELALNPTKTRIIELPVPLAHPWASELRSFNFRLSPTAQRDDLIRYFDRAFILSKEYPGEPVLRYTIARLRGVNVQPSNWEFVQQVLYQCVLVEPGTLSHTVAHLLHYQLRGFPIDVGLLQDVMNRQIIYHAPRGHGSEVAWAIWTLMWFGQKIEAAAGSSLAKIEDSVVALLAIDANMQGLVTGGLNTSTWQPYMITQELYGPHWLLSYEANVKGWLPSVGLTDHVSSDPNFGFLKQIGVSFYDRSRPMSALSMTAFPYP